MTTPATEEDEEGRPEIFVDLKIVRRMGSLPPIAMRSWLLLKGLLFLAALAGVLLTLVIPDAEVPYKVRVLLAVALSWLVWERIVARRHWGTSHVLMTTKGVLLTDENVYVRWEDIESWQHHGNLMRIKPRAGAGPQGFFAASELDIPLGDSTRDFVVDLFRERAPRKR